jgi:uncharacterized membrane protein
MSGRRLRTVLALGLLTVFDVALVALRIYHADRVTFSFLVWNLFLAWIPFLLALALYDGVRRRRHPAVLAALGAGWLLFFPNAPYMVTDVIHVAPRPGSPLWFDSLTITSAAFTGLLLGFVSLGLVQEVARRAAGAVWSWALAGGVLLIASVGIYLGRFQRLNSWDVVAHPHELAALARTRLADPFGNPKLIVVVALMTAFLGVTYAVFAALWAVDENGGHEHRVPR